MALALGSSPTPEKQRRSAFDRMAPSQVNGLRSCRWELGNRAGQSNGIPLPTSPLAEVVITSFPRRLGVRLSMGHAFLHGAWIIDGEGFPMAGLTPDGWGELICNADHDLAMLTG